MSHFLLSSLVSLQPNDNFWNIFSLRPQRINIVSLLESTVHKSFSEIDYLPVKLYYSPPLLNHTNLSFNIFLWDDPRKTFNKTRKTMIETTMTTSMMSHGLTSLENPLDIEFNEDIKSNYHKWSLTYLWL